MIGDVCAQDHLGNDLSDIPVLGFGKELKDVILWVKEQLECNGAVMVLQNRDVIVSQSFLMLDANQEVVVNTWMSYVVQHASQKSCHDLKIREMAHQLSVLDEVVEVSSRVNHSQGVVELGSFIAF